MDRGPLKPGDVIADCEIVRLIGSGGMAAVFLARHRTLQRDVAIKVITADATTPPEWRTRFAREQRVAAAIDHPNVIPIFAAGIISILKMSPVIAQATRQAFGEIARLARGQGTQGGEERTDRSLPMSIVLTGIAAWKRKSGLGKAAGVLAVVLLVAMLVAVWAMGAKPD